MPSCNNNKCDSLWLKLVAVIFLSAMGMSQAFALPAFARQTGDSCDACHVGAYGPQLTTHGMKFKLSGYTDSDGNSGHLPLSGMLIENYTHTSKDQNPVPADGYSANNNSALQELSGFLAGKLTDHVGSFMQVTYSGIEKKTALDNTEFRFASDGKLLGEGAVYGILVNNNPTMQDLFNTLPAWGFPFTSSDLAPGPDSTTIINDGIAGTVYGVSAYTLMKNGIYAELGDYKTFSRGFLENVNVIAADDSLGQTIGLAPYWRFAYFKDLHKQAYSAGLVGMSAKLRVEGTPGPDSKVSDIGVDGHYQYLGTRRHIFSVDGMYIDENNKTSGFDKTKLHQFNLAGSYYYDKSYGVTAKLFDTTGSEVTDNSKGMTLQGDWTPFGKENSPYAPYANLRLGLQYTSYNELNGDTSNASDSNSIMLFVWLAG